MKNYVFDRFTENWMQGGAKAREAFMRDFQEVLKAERERCAVLAETFIRRRYGRTGGAPALLPTAVRIAEEIRELL